MLQIYKLKTKLKWRISLKITSLLQNGSSLLRLTYFAAFVSIQILLSSRIQINVNGLVAKKIVSFPAARVIGFQTQKNSLPEC